MCHSPAVCFGVESTHDADVVTLSLGDGALPLHRRDTDDDGERRPGDALRAGGAAASRVVKVVLLRSRTGDQSAVVLCPAAEKVDLSRVARCLKWKGARLATPLELLALLADPDTATADRDVGIVLMDTLLLDCDTVVIAAGSPLSYIEIPPAELQRLTHARETSIIVPRARWE